MIKKINNNSFVKVSNVLCLGSFWSIEVIDVDKNKNKLRKLKLEVPILLIHFLKEKLMESKIKSMIKINAKLLLNEVDIGYEATVRISPFERKMFEDYQLYEVFEDKLISLNTFT